MGIAVAPKARYENAVRKLFPQGSYWEGQFADPESDVSLFAKAKADELMRFRRRMGSLYNESRTETAGELMDCWERVLLGKSNTGKTPEERRLLLGTAKDDCLNRAALQKAAGIFGFCIIGICFPYHPAFFGFSRFGIGRIAGPASWQAVNISVGAHGGGDRVAFEAHMRQKLLASCIPQFFYDGGKP